MDREKVKVTTVDLIRHGEPVGGRKYRGQIDDPLSEKGWAQMRNAVGDFCPWQCVISSALLRCAAFAQELAQRHALPLILDERLKEIGFGAWAIGGGAMIGNTAIGWGDTIDDESKKAIHRSLEERGQYNNASKRTAVYPACGSLVSQFEHLARLF